MICTKCGREMPEGAKFCSVCGTPASPPPQAEGGAQGMQGTQIEGYGALGGNTAPGWQGAAQTPPAAPPQPPQPASYGAGGSYQENYYGQTPAYGAAPGYYGPAEDERTRPMSMGEYVLTLIVLAIPLVGIVCTIIWAVSGTANLNRRNLARAILILMGVWIAIIFLLSISIVGMY